MSKSDSAMVADRLRVLGGFATAELLVRGVGDASLAKVLEVASDWIPAGTAFALSQGWVEQTIGSLLMWLVFGYAVYTFLPRLLPTLISDSTEDNLLVTLVALGAIVMAQPPLEFAAAVRSSGTSAFSYGGAFFWIVGFYFFWTVVTFSYFRLFRSEKILAEEGLGRRVVSSVDDSQTTMVLDKPPAERTMLDSIGRGVIQVRVAMKFAGISFGLGFSLAALSLLYPVPELLFVGAAIIGQVSSRTDRFKIAPSVTIERDLGSSISTVLRHEKGIGILFMTVMGMIASASMFIVGLALLYDLLDLVGERLHVGEDTILEGGLFTLFSAEGLRASAILGVVATILAGAVLSMWVWIRFSKRSSSFLPAWRHRWEDKQESPPETEVSRPVGGTVFPVLLASVAGIPLREGFELGAAGVSQITIIYGLLWPVGLIITALWIWDTLRREPQAPLTDNWLYPVSIGVMFAYLYIGSRYVGRVEPLMSGRHLAGLAGMLSMVLLIHGYPDIEKYLERCREPWSSLSKGVVFWPAPPLILLSLEPQMPSSVDLVLGATALLAVLAGVFQIAWRYQSQS